MPSCHRVVQNDSGACVRPSAAKLELRGDDGGNSDDLDYGWGTVMNIQADFREPPHEAV